MRSQLQLRSSNVQKQRGCKIAGLVNVMGFRTSAPVLRLQPDFVPHGVRAVAAYTPVPLCRLDRNVTEQELNLIQFTSRCVTEPRARPATVVWCEVLHPAAFP